MTLQIVLKHREETSKDCKGKHREGLKIFIPLSGEYRGEEKRKSPSASTATKKEKQLLLAFWDSARSPMHFKSSTLGAGFFTAPSSL